MWRAGPPSGTMRVRDKKSGQDRSGPSPPAPLCWGKGQRTRAPPRATPGVGRFEEHGRPKSPPRRISWRRAARGVGGSPVGEWVALRDDCRISGDGPYVPRPALPPDLADAPLPAPDPVWHVPILVPDRPAFRTARLPARPGHRADPGLHAL